MDHPDYPADAAAMAPASPHDLVQHLCGYEGQLRAWGLHVDGVAEGQRALDEIRQARHPYRLVVLEAELPDRPGLDLARAVRGLGDGAALAL